MKKIKTLIAAAAVLGLGVTVSSISPAAVSMQTAEAATVKQGLVKVKNKYYYYNAKGKKVKNKWVTVDSCMGAGMDGILKYQGFIVYTYKENGKEIIQGFE